MAYWKLKGFIVRADENLPSRNILSARRRDLNILMGRRVLD
jgi:hypothetical protein